MPTIDPDGLSPWELAHGGQPYDQNDTDTNAENEWDRRVAALYEQFPTGELPDEHRDTNLYDIDSLAWTNNVPGGGTPTPTPTPSPTTGRVGDSCFKAGTHVSTPSGPVAIEAIAIGDTVIATSSGETAHVVAVHIHRSDTLLCVTSMAPRQLYVTANHPIWSVDKKGFVPASTLAGQRVLLRTGITTTVTGVTVAAHGGAVYNLTVEPNHTYFAEDVWVHNKMYAPTGPKPTPRPTPSPDPRWTPPGFAAFNDPYTKQFEALLQAQLELMRQQQAEMRRASEAAQQRRSAAETRRGQLEAFINERVGKLKGPAYTGTEQEVLRTQLLDPIERDRSAAQQRALQRISARGLTPESGIAADLQRLVDEEFNQMRTSAQGGLAQRQIEEQRSREQEAQQLLTFLMQLPDAAARGDLDFLNTIHGYIAQPGRESIQVGDILSELPTRRLNDALRVLGVAPQGLSSPTSPSSGNTQILQLLQLLQNNRGMNQNAWGNYFGNLGTSFQP